jgi:zinc transporter ZupT
MGTAGRFLAGDRLNGRDLFYISLSVIGPIFGFAPAIVAFIMAFAAGAILVMLAGSMTPEAQARGIHLDTPQ